MHAVRARRMNYDAAFATIDEAKIDPATIDRQ
jgi:hypothetical protein